MSSTRWVVLGVMMCHFIAAFAALGMPPFFALILDQSLHSDAVYLAGWFYIVPTFFAAISSPWWGKLSDKFGKKRLLIRAQLGLSASFLLASFATNSWTFLAALILQGLLGGTFAASNAYLSSIVSGPSLMRGLTAMQWSARAALVIAPVCFSIWITYGSPILLYRYLALLPLCAAACIAFFPTGNEVKKKSLSNGVSDGLAEATTRQIYALQFMFVFATVVTFPYFIPHIQQQFPNLMFNWSGLLFGLPHLVYLVFALVLTRWIGKRHHLATLGMAFLLLFTSLIGQSQLTSMSWLITWRIAMGISMTISYIVLHAMIATAIVAGAAGKTFGLLESSSKWGGVAAGLCAGLAASQIGMKSPFWLGAAVIGAGIIYIFSIKTNWLRWGSLKTTAKENS